MSEGSTEAAPPKRRRGFLPGLIALTALVVIGALLGAGDLEHPAPHDLNGSEVASQIALGLQVQQNSARAPAVTCPPKEPVRAGWAFNCTVAGHQPRTLHVTEVDSRGRVQWAWAS